MVFLLEYFTKQQMRTLLPVPFGDGSNVGITANHIRNTFSSTAILVSFHTGWSGGVKLVCGISAPSLFAGVPSH